MNRCDYYSQRSNWDEQEWLTDAIYYPEQEHYTDCDIYTSNYDAKYDMYDSCDEAEDVDDSEYEYYYNLYENEKKPYRESPNTDIRDKGGEPI